MTEPRRKTPKVPPPTLPTAPPLANEVVWGAAILLSGDGLLVHPGMKALAEKARAGKDGGDGCGAVGTHVIAPEFLEDLLACWDFLHLMGVAETEVWYHLVEGMLYVALSYTRLSSFYCWYYYVSCLRPLALLLLVEAEFSLVLYYV